jgi:hypothetical protein
MVGPTCNLNILDTCIGTTVPPFQNRGMTDIVARDFDTHNSSSPPCLDRACDTSSEPSPDGHVGQGWLLTTSWSAHPRCHDSLDDIARHPGLYSHHACRSKLTCDYGWGVRGLDEQWDMGTSAPAPWLQHHRWQVDLSAQVPIWRDVRSLQGLLGPLKFHTMP